MISLGDIVAFVCLRREVRPVKERICCDREAGIDRSYSAVLLVPLFGIEHAIERRPATTRHKSLVSCVRSSGLQLAVLL